MRILEVTFIPPDMVSGGGYGILQSIRSILANAEMDYIGPEFDNTVLDKLDSNNLRQINFLTAERYTIRSAVRSVAHYTTTSFYNSWKRVLSHIKWSEYDWIHIESSRYYFVVKEAQKYHVPVIVRLHNIEHDYGKNEFLRKKNFGSFVRYVSFSLNEKNCIRKADQLVFITENDIKTAGRLYGLTDKNSTINPVCMDSKTADFLNDSTGEFWFLITGSLSFGPNADGVKWFIENVWNRISENFNVKLMIAGSHPDDTMKNIVLQSKNIEIIDSPEDMEPYLIRADAYLAPVFEGAGMKVKVAEALSYGLPVIGTKHAWIGYEFINEGKWVADSAEEFVNKITSISKIKVTAEMKKRIQTDFNREYSTDASIDRYRNILKNIC